MKFIKDMTEPELRTYYDLLMDATLAITPTDVDCVLIFNFTDQGMGQYVCSKKLDGVPAVLRGLADVIEKGDMVTR